jgi:uncharacterized membrane protein YqjE
MNSRNSHAGAQGPTLAEVVRDIKDELKEFVQTRAQMLKAEMQEKISTWKTGALLAVIAVKFLGTAYLFLSLALVGLVVVAFWGSPYAWFLGFLIVGVFWGIVGGLLAPVAIHQFRAQGVAPKKTMRVLKEDKVVAKRGRKSNMSTAPS